MSINDRIMRIYLRGPHGEEVSVSFDERQVAHYEERAARAFIPRHSSEEIESRLEEAGNIPVLERFAIEENLCDVCSLSGINLYGAKRTLGVVVKVLGRFPGVRRYLSYIGTHQGLEDLLSRLQKGDQEVARRFKLRDILSTEDAVKVASVLRAYLSDLALSREKYTATAMAAYGLFDALLLDAEDYDGYRYLTLNTELRRSAASGFHPQGCYSVESVVYHEFGHFLDDLCKMKSQPAFLSYRRSLTDEEVARGLSKYAMTSAAEFIAEAFAEYMCSPLPRPIAAKVGEMLVERYACVVK